MTVSAQAAEKVKASVQKVKDKAQAIVDEIEVSANAVVGYLFIGCIITRCMNILQADKVVSEKKLSAAKPALDEAEAALQVCIPYFVLRVVFKRILKLHYLTL